MATKPPPAGRTLKTNITEALLDLCHGRALHDDELLWHGPEAIKVDYSDSNHRYKINGEHVPSVTTVLDATMPKPALSWWAFRVGMAGVVRALQDSKLSLGVLSTWDWENVIKPSPDHPDTIVNAKTGKAKSPMEIMAMEMRHHPNAIKEERGTVGTSIHAAAEIVALEGQVPVIEEFPEADRGYVQALARFYVEMEPEFELIEVIRASWHFAYAGRFDGICRYRGGEGERRGIDYKTSGGVYDSYDVQCSGYDLAYLEMGGEPLQGWDVVHLRPDGSYEVVPMRIDHADFLLQRLALEQTRERLEVIKGYGR